MGEFMLNSVIVTALALVILLAVALPASYALSRFEFKGRKFLNALFMGGLFINVNYIVVPIFLMLVDGDKFLKGMIGSGFCSVWLWYMRQRPFPLPSIFYPAILQRFPMILRRRPT